MATKLVIVESPAKAKTIGGYLGSDYEVLASIGHIRDLVPNGRALPPELKKKWWADYGVDVDNGFEPFYEVPDEKRPQVSKLKKALSDKSELVLATDEDREGEAISWHLLQVLQPKKSVSVKRIAFHEITRDAIQAAIQNPREIDLDLVEAQEARRILDRLYGYTLSPLLWSKINKNLSAGRVQSPAVKLIVERERARAAFKSAEYWDLRATFKASGQPFPGTLVEIDGKRIASGRDFDPETGTQLPDSKTLVLSREQSGELAALAQAQDFTVSSVATREATQKPSAPFMTTTLQQDANRKFGMGAERTMRIAQTLYEGIDLGGEQVGLITYMRTDSLTLGQEALTKIRAFIGKHYPAALPGKPVSYSNRVKNAQEAHEAIRPTDVSRTPDQIAKYLTDDQYKIYSLIWQRTVACQMLPAKLMRTEARIECQVGSAIGDRLSFLSTGVQIVEPGFLAVYQEGKDEDAAGDDRVLPPLNERQVVDLVKLSAMEHHTAPPARYTDATLIKRLEELGIGRPSTYASIISVIVDRGYARKEGKQLVPTWRAFMAMEVLDNHFQEVLDLGFTAQMDEALDEISEGKIEPNDYLREFFIGQESKPGLKTLVDERKLQIPFPNLEIGKHPETGEAIIVRTGKDGGAFIQLGDKKAYANVPDDLAPADLTLEKALELLQQKNSSGEVIGKHPESGRNLMLKFRQGYYLEVERTPEEIEAKVKPTWIGLPAGEDPRTFTPAELEQLCTLPRLIGKATDGEEVTFQLGKFGPYIRKGSEFRTVENWRTGLSMTMAEAEALLAQPKTNLRRAPAGPIQSFGEQPGCAGEVKVLAGRFGPYVTDGETNATLPRGTDPATISVEFALDLLQKKREAGPAPGPARRKAPAKPAGPKGSAKKATAKKPAARQPAAKQVGAKKSLPKKK